VLSLLLVAAAFSGHGPVWTGCEHVPRTRPAKVIVACADANFYVDHLTWTSWKTGSATAVGTGHANDCKPYCAAGHFHAFRIAIQLTKPASCVKGRTEFTRIAWSAIQRPAGFQDGSITFRCFFLKLKR